MLKTVEPYELVAKTKTNGLIDVTKYLFPNSGLTLVICDVQGPMVSAYLNLATETDTDDGLPHTLEHLVFLGSKLYPYKGLLDLLANRCLASGTNAWTGQDHTCYTLTTAGQEGFLKMLPIYLDHILNPLLTDAAFHTEVHHINGKGEDAGVVYSEMQDYEAKMKYITEWKLNQLMYPPGSGYRVETGGRLHALRTSCSNARVRNFHKQFYQAKNLMVVVLGQVDHEKLLNCVAAFEGKNMTPPFISMFLPQEVHMPWVRPFQSEIKPFAESETVEKLCPARDESRGMVRIGYRGPKSMDVEEFQAVCLLAEYLTLTAASPLQKNFVQQAQPLCSTVQCAVLEQYVSAIVFTFNGVPSEHLEEIKPKFHATVSGLLADSNDFKIAHMKSIIKQNILRCEEQLENNAYETISQMLIYNQLYSTSAQQFEQRMNNVSTMEALSSKPVNFWLTLLNKYLHPSVNCICVIGRPSSAEVERITEAERMRLAEQKQKLGENGLQKASVQLESAIDENEKTEPDQDLLDRCIVHSLKDIHYVNITSSSNLSSQTSENSPMRDMPFTTTLDYCTTNFVEMTMQFDTFHLPIKLKPYVLLWSRLIFESPIQLPDGTIQPYDEVVKQINSDLVNHYVSLGNSGKYTYLICLHVKVHKEDYPKGVEWLHRFVHSVQFTAERITVAIKKLLSTAVTQKRKGRLLTDLLLNQLMVKKDSNAFIHSSLRQEHFLKNLLNTDPDQIISSLNELRNHMTKQMSVHIMCDTAQIPTPLAMPWIQNFAQTAHTKQTFTKQSLCLNLSSTGQGVIMAVAASESTYVFQSIPLISDCSHPDLPALMTFLQYLDQGEGPLYRQIRGKGLAYGVHIGPEKDCIDPDTGVLTLNINRCSQPVQAYKETRAIVMNLLDNVDGLDKAEFDAAKRSLIYTLIEREETVSAASLQSLLSYYRNVPGDYNHDLCKKIWDLDIEELVPVARKYVKKLFDFSVANTAITCHPSKLNEIVAGFAEMGKLLQIATIEDKLIYI